MVGTGIEKKLILAKNAPKPTDAFLAEIEASDQRFLQDSYSFTW